jgi:hypothetical protein
MHCTYTFAWAQAPDAPVGVEIRVDGLERSRRRPVVSFTMPRRSRTLTAFAAVGLQFSMMTRASDASDSSSSRRPASRAAMRSRTEAGSPGRARTRSVDRLASIRRHSESTRADSFAPPARPGRVTLFLKNISDFQAMNEAYAKFFPGVPPARSTVQAVLPNDAALVEIDVIAME